jgi:hypothetical protein
MGRCGVRNRKAPPAAAHDRFRLRPEDVIRACTPPSHVSAARAHTIRNDKGPRQDAAAGPRDCPSVQRNGPFKMLCESCGSPLRGPRADPVWITALLPSSSDLPSRGSGRALWGRAWRLVAITPQRVYMRHAHTASFIRTGSPMPLPRCRRSVPLARITRVEVRIDIGLCVGSLHSHEQSENTQASDQSALHQTSSLSTSKCHSFYWVASTRIKSKRQRVREATFLGVS